VSAKHGAVIVNGSIGSYTEKYTAERDVRRVHGVVSVQDDLEVRRQREAAYAAAGCLVGVNGVSNSD
jgi:hypothetical protein